MANYKEYLVGGYVRDELLNVKSKDKDYTFVFENASQFNSVEEAFNKMYNIIKEKGEIFLSTPNMFTIRYKDKSTKEVKDVVLARKETGYIEGTRRPIVVPGTLHDDLQRRDFTCNAIAKDLDTGEYIDPFEGQQAIKAKWLMTPVDPSITFADDPLRLLRAIRFSITKGFKLDWRIQNIILHFDYENKFDVVSAERIREELHKCFKANTALTLQLSWKYLTLFQYCFTKTGLWLKPTNEL